MKYRSKIDVIVTILNIAAHGPVRKTRIMYEAFLSSRQLKEYLAILLDEELLEFDKLNNVFKSTPRGIHFLRIWSEIDTLYPPVVKAR